MRAFIALPLPDALLNDLEQLQHRLPLGRAARRDTLHLTLAFLGDCRDETLETLHDELSELRAPAFDVQLSGLGSFGKQAPRVLFADVAANRDLSALRKRIRSAMRRAGLETPHERFHPHVTLARFTRDPRTGDPARLAGFIAAHAAFRPPPFRADTFTLFQSTLRPEGPRHDALASYRLR